MKIWHLKLHWLHCSGSSYVLCITLQKITKQWALSNNSAWSQWKLSILLWCDVTSTTRTKESPLCKTLTNSQKEPHLRLPSFGSCVTINWQQRSWSHSRTVDVKRKQLQRRKIFKMLLTRMLLSSSPSPSSSLPSVMFDAPKFHWISWKRSDQINQFPATCFNDRMQCPPEYDNSCSLLLTVLPLSFAIGTLIYFRL